MIFKMLACFLLLLSLAPAALAQDKPLLRGYDPDTRTYQYVTFGVYPYGENGERAPVLWRVLERTGERMLRSVERSMCTYTSVVVIDSCPSICCMARKLAPPSSRCVAKLWRKVCGLTVFFIPAKAHKSLIM